MEICSSRNPLLAGHPFGLLKSDGLYATGYSGSRNPLLAGHPFGLEMQEAQAEWLSIVAIPY